MKWLFILLFLFNIAFFSYANYFSTTSNSYKTNEGSTVANQLKLLTEIDPKKLQKIKKIKPINNIPETVTSEKNSPVENIPVIPSIIDRSNKVISSQCFNIGPLEKKIMDDIRFILEDKYTNFISFEIEATSAITYHRIYIPPQDSQSKIDKILKTLDENDLNDHYVMSIDGRKNAIALGVFKNRKTAEKIAKKVKYLGYSTTIEAITRDKNSLYNLKLDFKKDQDLTFYDAFLLKNNLKSTVCKNND